MRPWCYHEERGGSPQAVERGQVLRRCKARAREETRGLVHMGSYRCRACQEWWFCPWRGHSTCGGMRELMRLPEAPRHECKPLPRSS
jgi:epoxyqueuosine reductase QueG